MMPFSDDELVEPVKSVLGKQLYILEQDGGGLEFLARGVWQGGRRARKTRGGLGWLGLWVWQI